MSQVLTDANFDGAILQSDKLCVVDFWATWCPPCLALSPIMDALSAQYDGRVVVGKINADENPQTCITYGVTNLPCILLVKGGKVVERIVGYATKPHYEKKINRLLEL